MGSKIAYIKPGSPSDKGYCESFNACIQDELQNREIFYSLKEAEILIEQWRKRHNTERLQRALGYRSPTLETIIPPDQMPNLH